MKLGAFGRKFPHECAGYSKKTEASVEFIW